MDEGGYWIRTHQHQLFPKIFRIYHITLLLFEQEARKAGSMNLTWATHPLRRPYSNHCIHHRRNRHFQILTLSCQLCQQMVLCDSLTASWIHPCLTSTLRCSHAHPSIMIRYHVWRSGALQRDLTLSIFLPYLLQQS